MPFTDCLMKGRFMRVMVLFDLPVETAEERRAYTGFRKQLIRKGFVMMQESVYTKIVQNPPAARAVISYIRSVSPKEGLIQVLVITEKQYAGMELIIGHVQKEIIDTNE